MLELADGWMGEGCELARRILAYADHLDLTSTTTVDDVDALAKTICANELRSIIRKEWNPSE